MTIVVDSKSNDRYTVNIVSVGVLYRATVSENIFGGDDYHSVQIALGDFGDKESATRSFKRYCKKYLA